jgi:hypothetical protein
MDWQREEWKEDSGWIEENGDWGSEAVGDVEKRIRAC